MPPTAPTAVVPDFTPATPTAPAAVVAAASGSAPTAPAAVVAGFSASAPTAPAAVVAAGSGSAPTAPAAVVAGFSPAAPSAPAAVVAAASGATPTAPAAVVAKFEAFRESLVVTGTLTTGGGSPEDVVFPTLLLVTKTGTRSYYTSNGTIYPVNGVGFYTCDMNSDVGAQLAFSLNGTFLAIWVDVNSTNLKPDDASFGPYGDSTGYPVCVVTRHSSPSPVVPAFSLSTPTAPTGIV